MRLLKYTGLILAVSLIGGEATLAQTTPPADADKSAQTDAPAAEPASLVVYFASGSSTLRAADKNILDQASRAYNEGKPIVMILTGTADRAGEARNNLLLSQRRATAVLNGLLDRGIPADRFQVLAKGETELPVPTSHGTSEPKDRRVEITWH